MPVSTTPITSSTAGPGLVPYTPSRAEGPTNAAWIELMVNYWSSRWAHGDHTVPDGWVSALYGEPDGEDVGGVAGPRTILAFTRYFKDYKPGKDASVDQLTPYVPPGPSEFIETPEQTAARVAQANFQLSLETQAAIEREKMAQEAQQFGVTSAQDQQRIDLDIQKRLDDWKRTQIDAFNQGFANELSKFSTQAGIYGAQLGAQGNIYGTQAGIYSGQESNRSANLQQAGVLSQALQQAMDKRTENAINLRADPSNAVERELAVRALDPAQAKQVPAYSNVDSLTEVINRLINYVPNAAPTAPTVPTPVAPAAPNASTYQLPGPVASALGTSPSNLSSGQTQMGQAPLPADFGDPNKVYTGTGNQYKFMAAGSGPIGTAARSMVIGDPQMDGEPNPEMVQVISNDPNTRTVVTPLRDMSMAGAIRKFAYGTDQITLPSYKDATYQNMPGLKYIQGRSPTSEYDRLSTGYARGAFGEQIPESGRINYAKYLRIAKDPISLALLSSQYRGANRNLEAEVSRAKARAPFGQALATSLIRT